MGQPELLRDCGKDLAGSGKQGTGRAWIICLATWHQKQPGQGCLHVIPGACMSFREIDQVPRDNNKVLEV